MSALSWWDELERYSTLFRYLVSTAGMNENDMQCSTLFRYLVCTAVLAE